MFEIDSTLDAVFLGAFLFGLLFAVISLAAGVVDFGADHGADHGHDGGHDYINFSVILAFIAWFGGVGHLASNGAGWTAAVSIGVGIAGGLVGAAIMYQIYARVVRPAGQTQLDPRDFEMTGKLARVTSSIRAGGMGEIVYEQSGARMVRAARSQSGGTIPRGTDVVVMDADRGVAIVATWDEVNPDPYAALSAPAPELDPLDVAPGDRVTRQ
ncbi:MAG: NfeD family protein [Thermomicrobiales bacterium]|nr:NfeD family protein [Thermomicrobiales bacterium]